MKARFLTLFLFLAVCTQAQQHEKLVKPFYVRWNTYYSDTLEEQERYFSVRLPNTFTYDTTTTWASDLNAQLFAVDFKIDTDPLHAWKSGDYSKPLDLLKYAQGLTKNDLVITDSSSVTDWTIDKQVRNVNGFPMIGMQYHLVESFNGLKTDQDCYLYLISVFPDAPHAFKKSPHVVYLRFSAKTGKRNVFPDHNPEDIIKTIKKY